MRLIIDNNLSFKLVNNLAPFQLDCIHVRDVLGISASDLIIWEYARKESLVILTKDNDFNERSQLLGCPPKVIHLICGNISTKEICNQLIASRENIFSFGERDFDNCLMKIVF